MHQLRDETGLIALEGHVRCSGDALHFEPQRLESVFGARAWTLPLDSLTSLELSAEDRLLLVKTASGTAKLRGRAVFVLHGELVFALATRPRPADPVFLTAGLSRVDPASGAPSPGRVEVRVGGLTWTPEAGPGALAMSPPVLDTARLATSARAGASLVFTSSEGAPLRLEGPASRSVHATWLLARAASTGQARAFVDGCAVREGPLTTRGRLVLASRTFHFLPDPTTASPERDALVVPIAELDAVLVEGSPPGPVLVHGDRSIPIEPEDPQAALGALRDAMLDAPAEGPRLDVRGWAVDPLSPSPVQQDGFAPSHAMPCLAEFANGGVHRAWIAWNQYEVRLLSWSIRLAWKSSHVARNLRRSRVLELEAEGESVRITPMGGDVARAAFAESLEVMVPEALLGARESQHSSATSTGNRRRAFRATLPRFWRSARVRVGGASVDVPATVLDLSPDGCGLSVEMPVPVGTPVEVEFRLGSGALQLGGTVVRADAPDAAVHSEHKLGIALERPPNSEVAGVLDHVWRLAQRRTVPE